MTVPDPKNLVITLANRSKVNLSHIEDIAKTNPGNAYEVTQLLNSLLCLIVFPVEQLRERRFRIPRQEAQFLTNLLPHTVSPYLTRTQPKRILIGIRNAISHGNIHFIGNTDNNIETIALWNIPEDQIEPDMVLHLTASDLRGLVENTLTILATNSVTSDRNAKYERIKKLAQLD